MNWLEEECWKAVPDYEGIYEISDRGRVRSLDRIGFRGWSFKGKVLSPIPHSGGYLCVGLWVDGKGKSCYIHRLVALVFLGPCPEGMQVHHHDGQKTNNNLANLHYVTPAENIRHAFNAGLIEPPPPPYLRGEDHGQSKLTETDIREIRQTYESGEITQRQLAAQYGVDESNISLIVNHESWSWLD